jgi:hypothetical protein
MSDTNDGASKAPKRSDHLQVWLVEAGRRQGLWCFGFGAAAALGSVVAVGITFWVVWFVLVFTGGSLLGWGTVWAAWGITIALLPIHLFTNRQQLENVQFERDPHLRMAYRAAPYVDAGWVALANKDNARAFVKILSMLLLAWPQLAVAAWRFVAQGLRLKSIDPPGPSKVLSHLLTQERKFTFDELIAKFPKLDVKQAVVPLYDVEGIVLRMTDPPGLSLEDDLRQELAEFLGARM